MENIKKNDPCKTDAPHNAETDFTQRDLTDKIGSSLKRMYDDVVNEPVPDDFLALLASATVKDT